jgi:DNA repair protein RadC
MEYEVNISYKFAAASDADARDKAREYIAENLIVRPLRELVCSPAEVAEQCRNFRNKPKEHFCVFLLDTQNRIVGKEVISIGTLNASLIHPRETFRTAIRKNSCSIIVVHNHPSGSLEPSPEDMHVTRRLQQAGELLGIELLDHVIVTATAFVSFREKRLL